MAVTTTARTLLAKTPLSCTRTDITHHTHSLSVPLLFCSSFSSSFLEEEKTVQTRQWLVCPTNCRFCSRIGPHQPAKCQKLQVNVNHVQFMMVSRVFKKPIYICAHHLISQKFPQHRLGNGNPEYSQLPFSRCCDYLGT